MLSSIINQHPEINLFGQLFRDDEAHQKKIAELGVVKYNAPLFDDKIESRNEFEIRNIRGLATTNSLQFVSEFHSKFGKKNPSTWTGFKVHGGTVYDHELEKILTEIPHQVIILHRKNLLQAAISWAYARKHDQWVVKSENKITKSATVLNIDELKWFIENTRRDIDIWRDLIGRLNVNHIELTYEELTADYQYDKIWDFFKVKKIELLEVKTRKLISEYEHIINITEICEQLECAENGYLAT